MGAYNQDYTILGVHVGVPTSRFFLYKSDKKGTMLQ